MRHPEENQYVIAMIRISAVMEEADDLVADFENALKDFD